MDISPLPHQGASVSHPVEGFFKLVKPLAEGPFSDVFIVQHLRPSDYYAMKCEKEEGLIR